MNREEAIRKLYESIEREDGAIDALWDVILACQGEPFYTSSGLLFWYAVKRNRSGAYGGELEISRKEGSKTLTRSSVMLAFQKVMEDGLAKEADGEKGKLPRTFAPPFYKGPKAIGQIFGISYLYGLFWKIGLIRIPQKTEERLENLYREYEKTAVLQFPLFYDKMKN